MLPTPLKNSNFLMKNHSKTYKKHYDLSIIFINTTTPLFHETKIPLM